MVNLDEMTEQELEDFLRGPKKHGTVTKFAEHVWPGHEYRRRFPFVIATKKLLQLAWILRYGRGKGIEKLSTDTKKRYARIYNSLPEEAQYPHKSFEQKETYGNE